MKLSYYESIAERTLAALDAQPTSLLIQQLPHGYVRAQVVKNLKGLRKCQDALDLRAPSALASDLMPLFAEALLEAARLLGVTSTPVVSPARWLCIDCGVVVSGDDKDAGQHLEQPGCFDHWMYELRRESELHNFEPTGREVHSSDGGGYYLSNHMTAAEVDGRFAHRFIRGALERT